MINNSSPRRIPTKPSGGNVAHGVLKAPVHSAGSSPRHRPRDFSRPPATMVGQKHNPSGDTERKTSKKCIVEAWYNFYVSVKKGRSVSGLGLFVFTLSVEYYSLFLEKRK